MFYKRILYIITSLLIVCSAGKMYAQELSPEQYFALAKTEGNKKRNFAKAAQYCELALKETPNNLDIKEYLGKCYMEIGQVKKARVTLVEVLQKDDKRTAARYYLTNLETGAKRYSAAICYVNELLEFSPYNKNLWMRKVNLYNLMGNTREANREIKRLQFIFPQDPEIQTMYANVLKENALATGKSGNLADASEQYEQAIMAGTKDAELYLSLINIYTKAGDHPAALYTANRGLTALPGNSQLMRKKIGALEQMHDYQQAISLIEAENKKRPSAENRKLMAYLTEEAARYYRNTDPYTLYGKIYSSNKQNKEAHDYLLNTAISRGYYADAQEILSRDLKNNPNSKQLLSKQLFVYESQQNRQGVGRTVTRLYELYPNDSDVRDKYDAYTFQEAKMAFNDGDYEAAMPVFMRLSNHPEYGMPASNYIYSIYLDKKQYGKAMDHIEGLIASNPNNQDYILRKIGLLAEMQEFDEAYNMAKDYMNNNPGNEEYKNMFVEMGLAYSTELNKNQDYARVKTIADEVLKADPQNRDAYSYAIGARIGMAQYDEALALIENGRAYFNDSKELRLKEAGVYAQMGDYEKAAEIHKELLEKYPYNTIVKSGTIENMFLAAKQQEEKGEPFIAKDIYAEILTIKPNDTLAAIKLANIHIARQEYGEAMIVVDKSLEYNKNNPTLLYTKGMIYEEQKDYALAKEYQSKYIPPSYKVAEHREHLDYLDAKMKKNQFNVTYLKATADSIPFNLSVGTIEYVRYEKNNTYVARANYTARESGAGIQGEADWYHTFAGKSYFLANAAIASDIFPKVRVGFSYYQPFAKTWTAEIGGRYTMLQDKTNLYTGIAGIEKTIGNVWLNARVFIINVEDNFYNTVLGQARFYTKEDRDYLMAMASIGNAPEDLRLDFQLNNFLSYATTMVGGGYFHYLSNSTSVGFIGNWYNYQISDDYHLNQYTFLLSLRTKF